MGTTQALSALKARLLASGKARSMEVPRETLQDAVDTIERLQKELDGEIKAKCDALAQRTIAHVERDAARAEVKQLKAELAKADAAAKARYVALGEDPPIGQWS